MYRYYFKFKDKDKTSRWLYDKEIDEWKKSRSSAYSNNFLNKFIIAMLLLALLIAYLVLTFSKKPPQ